MTPPRICKHCNGTTYCGGRISASTGRLKTQPACPTCLVKSNLDPGGIFDRVVCSVCHGTGLVHVVTESPPSKPARTLLYSVLGTASLAAVIFLAVTLYFFSRELDKADRVRNEVEQRALEAARQSYDSLRERVSIGMTREQVQQQLGEPDKFRQIAADDSDLELWDYQCRDGARVQISFRDGRVQNIQQ